MTDAPTVPDFPGHVTANLSPETKATFTDQMTKAGYSKADVEARLGGVLAGPSAEQIAATAEQFRKSWTGDKATLDAALAKLEATSKPGATSAVPASLMPPNDMSEYHLNFASHARSMTAEGFADLSAKVTSGFKAAEVPTALGQPILDAMLNSADAMRGMNTAQTNQYKQDQRAMLSKAGPVDELVRFAAVALIGMPDATVQMLRQRGSFETASVISALAAAGRAKEYRESKKS